MNISTLVISDIDRFEEMKEFWDKKVEPQITDPFFSSSMLIAHWRFGQEMEENPFLIIFSIKEEIIGFSAFLSKSSFGFRQVHN
ncbi:MAG: hypothetical protein H2B01_09405, partial [Nitrosopumilaceae archaeon]|nr:hypothetical protein [Nitrosopumilaceae archaeon]